MLAAVVPVFLMFTDTTEVWVTVWGLNMMVPPAGTFIVDDPTVYESASEGAVPWPLTVYVAESIERVAVDTVALTGANVIEKLVV